MEAQVFVTGVGTSQIPLPAPQAPSENQRARLLVSFCVIIDIVKKHLKYSVAITP